MRLSPGTRIGPFEIAAVLGAGGMGEVYRAHDTRLGRDVAIKILPPHLTATTEARLRFEREARAIARINHPNVCTLHDVGHQDETAFLVLELVEGTALRDRLHGPSLPIDEIVRIALGIIDGLEAAHAKGVIHRDLKPGNVMLGHDGRVKVMDFGLATGVSRVDLATPSSPTLTHQPDDISRTSSAIGTVAYMSPEQARGESLDPRSDLFSFGAVLYEMIAGARAFPGATDAIVFDGILNKPVRRLGECRSDVPEELEQIVTRALEKNPASRYQAAANVRADLLRLKGRVDAGDPLPASVAARTRVPRRRPRHLVAGAILVAIAGAAWATWALRRDDPSFLGRNAIRLPVAHRSLDLGGALSPDGRRIAFCTDSGPAVQNVATGDMRVVKRSDETGRHYGSIAWHPDGNRIVLAESDSVGEVEFCSIDVVTGRREVLAHLGRYDERALYRVIASLSPDGRFLAVRREFSDPGEHFRQLNVIDLRTGAERPLLRVRTEFSICPPSWNPGSTRLAYLVKGAGRSTALETVDLKGARTVLLSDDAGRLRMRNHPDQTIAWLPRNRLAYAWQTRMTSALYDSELRVLRVDERTGRPVGEPRSLYNAGGVSIHSPSAAADGMTLTFTGLRASGGIRFARLRPNAKEITLPSAIDREAITGLAWSRDSRRIFVRMVGGASTGDDVYALDLDTWRLDPLATTGLTETPICLAPEGKELLVRQGRRLIAVPIDGGTQRVIAENFTGLVACAQREGGTCVLMQYLGADLIVRDFSTTTGVGPERFRFPGKGTPSSIPVADLSPDGERIVTFPDLDSKGVVLDSRNGSVIRRLRAPDDVVLQGVHWAADGKGLFASGMSGPEFWVSSLSDRGELRPIMTSESAWMSWVRPSPDGSMVAATTLDVKNELWLLQAKP